jgi:mRNA interferase HicA
MKRNELVRHLKQRGCEIDREGGEHSVFYNPKTKEFAAVPRHAEIKYGTVVAICKQLGVDRPAGR